MPTFPKNVHEATIKMLKAEAKGAGWGIHSFSEKEAVVLLQCHRIEVGGDAEINHPPSLVEE